MGHLNSEEAKTIVDECVSYIKEIDKDKPVGEFFNNFHNENNALLNKLYKLKKYINKPIIER